MGYATIDDIRGLIDETRLIRLTDDDDTGTVNEDIVAAVLESASHKIDLLLGRRYADQVPFDPVPPILRDLCVDIGGYMLHIRREEATGTFWETQYKDAVRFLKQLAEGDYDIGGGSEDTGSSAHEVRITGPKRVFSRSSLKGF